MAKITSSLLLIAVLLLSAGCANITAPTGGKRDIMPPKLVQISPSDSQLNAHPKRIDLVFDEYVTVNDAAKEVSISPLLPFSPVITGHGKSVTMKIPDTLLEPQTTYRISFGKAIKDLHEGNVYNNLTYTFSTGSYFDSMNLQGRVVNAQTGLPDSGSKVFLYLSRDTGIAVVRKKPMYITTVASNGAFVFKGLPPNRVFRIYALKEANDNLVYDDPGESVAFLTVNVHPGDTLPAPLLLFRTDTLKTLVDTIPKSQRPGRLSAADKPTKGYKVNIDTTDKNKRSFNINSRIALTFPPYTAVNTEKINIFLGSGDTLLPIPVQYVYDSSDSNTVVFSPAWLQNTVYTLKLMKGFAKDSTGLELSPSKYVFRTFEEEDYGIIKIQLPDTVTTGKYLLQVLHDNFEIYLQPVIQSTVTLKRLSPGKYSAQLIYDKNNNGIWDNGDLQNQRQPELVKGYPQPINLKAGWEQVIDFGK